MRTTDRMAIQLGMAAYTIEPDSPEMANVALDAAAMLDEYYDRSRRARWWMAFLAGFGFVPWCFLLGLLVAYN